MKTEKLRVMIVDASIDSGRLISTAIAEIQDVEVNSTVTSGAVAVAKLKRKPVDVILFDIERTDTDALETLREIRECFPSVGVVIVSNVSDSVADKTIQALEMGALDFVAKPGNDKNSIRAFCRQLMVLTGMFRSRMNLQRERLARIQRAPVISLPNKRTEMKQTVSREEASVVHQPFRFERKPDPRPSEIDVVVFGVSTGGPNALIEVIPGLPHDLGVPVFLVQHMPVLFTASLAVSLNKISCLRVTESTDGQEVLPNTVYIAPGGKHMVVRRKNDSLGTHLREYIELNLDAPENSCRPSVDVLLRSVAEVYDGKALVVIMTGMGNDGLQGVKVVKRKGGYCLSQTNETCVVYGMPKAVDEAGLSDEMVPLDRIADRVVSLVRRRGDRSI